MGVLGQLGKSSLVMIVAAPGGVLCNLGNCRSREAHSGVSCRLFIQPVAVSAIYMAEERRSGYWLQIKAVQSAGMYCVMLAGLAPGGIPK